MVLPPLGVQSGRHPSFALTAFGKRLGDYKNWREQLAAVVGEYQGWVEAQGLTHGDDDLRVYELIDALKADKLMIALVAEFSRGKTELINAIFFSEYKQRLLPSDAGRTTMCPTELSYQEGEAPCIKLLPMDTRHSSLTIAEYKRAGSHWKTLPLDLNDPRAMAQALHETVKTQTVTVEQATEWGLYHPSATDGVPPADGKLQVPAWRHAVINFPHPLLRQGLVILDTPGLNALGTEPELTLGMLPAAHSIVFVLAADTGVTKSDLDVWRNHVCAGHPATGSRHVVALNKVDALWDDLREPTAIAATLQHQIEETARVLGVSHNAIFPVSAQKGLLGKIKADTPLIERSGLRALEEKLANDVIVAKQTLIREKVAHDIGAIVDKTRGMVEARLAAVNGQLAELRELAGKSREAIHQVIDRVHDEKRAYDAALVEFQSTRVELSQHTKVLLDYLSVESFDLCVARIHNAMKESWTTPGLRAGMKNLFDDALATMEKADQQARLIFDQVTAAHERFHTRHGLARLRPPDLSLSTFRARLQRLYDEAEAFRNSPMTVMTEQHLLIKKFFVTLGSRARQIYVEGSAAAHQWVKAIMAPILAQAREHKLLMENRLENLQRIHENHESVAGRVAELEANRHNLATQLRTIDDLLRRIGKPANLPPPADG